MSTLEHLSADLDYLVSVAAALAFTGLALSAGAKALRRRPGPKIGWIAAAFGALAFFLLQDSVLDDFGVEFPEALNLDVVVLLTFPYLLLRFTGSFRRLPRWLELTCGAAALSITAATLALPALADSDADDSSTSTYLIAALIYWAFVSSVTVRRFWSAGHGQPTLAGRRMRLMSSATAVLAVTLLVVVVTLSQDSPVVDVLVQCAILLSALAFAVGFNPPNMIRASWARGEQHRLLQGTMRVLRAETVDDVARQLLPPTARLVGAAGAVLVDNTGVVVAGYGQAPEPGTLLADPGATDDDDREELPLGEHGQLVVWTSAYTPFFGTEETQLLQAMAAVAALALERLALLEEERQQRIVLERAHQEAERARQQATQADLAKSEFLSRMSHELRTPLNAILGFGQLLELSSLSDEDSEAVQHILVGGRHLLALIDDVLDISRVHAGTMTMSPEPVRATELVDDSLALIGPLASARSISLRTERDDAHAFVRTDRQRCRQVLLNLLSNALKYNHDGGEITLSCMSLDDQWLRISVADTGPGISLTRQERLFEPFQRLGAENSAIPGTGLGLAVSKQLMREMGGRIGLTSEPGLGSTFWIDLPLTDPPADEHHPDGAHFGQVRPESAFPRRQRSVLLIEDNLTNLRVMQAMIERRDDLAPLTAQRGDVGITIAQEHRPDVIILDLHLPDLSGREVLHRLQSDARTRNIPVIVATADATPGRAEQLKDEGAFAYLTKPVSMPGLLSTIDKACEAAMTPESA